jgi:hypothetical protein
VRIEVDPEALIAAGQQTGALGGQLARLSDALSSALGGGISSGLDPAGMNFGMKYGHQAGEFTSAVADAANAFTSVGLLLEATGHNYRNADAASAIGGPGPSGGVSGDPAKTLPAHVPPGPNGVTVPPPSKWYLVQPLLQVLPVFGQVAGVAMTWPSGNAPIMGVTATQWRNFATGFALIEPQLTGIKGVVGAQQIPEAAAMKTALDSLGTAISSLADVSTSVAQSITDFASGVQETQDAIRRLLDRLSFDGLWDTVTGFLTGEGDDILREVARDVGTTLNNFQQQVKGLVGLLDELTGLIGDAATAFQKWIRPILVEQFGDGLGNTLADAVTFYTDVQVGAVTGLIGTVSGVVAMADPDTWKGMAEMALSVAKDPSSLPGVLANMGKEFVAWDKWSGDHPGRAAGEAAFNIGSLFVPGGALSKTGSVAKGLNLSRRMLEEGRLPRVGELGSWTRGAPNTIEPPRVPEFTPASPGGIPPVRPEGIPGASPGTPGAGPAPSGSGPARTGESPAPAGRPSSGGAEGGAGPRAPQPSGPSAAPQGEPTQAAATHGGGSSGAEQGLRPYDQGSASATTSSIEPGSSLADLDFAHDHQAKEDAATDHESHADGGASTDSTHPHVAGHPSIGDVPISAEKVEEILGTEKGLRPTPDSYLPSTYIEDHLRNFEDGAARIILRSAYEEYGIGKPDLGRTEFVLTKADADAIISESGGDPVRIAARLGVPEDQLVGDSMVVVHFNSTSIFDANIPSGNEWGANSQWLPGGRLPGGDLEAVVHTEGMINGRDYTVTDIATGEAL